MYLKCRLVAPLVIEIGPGVFEQGPGLDFDLHRSVLFGQHRSRNLYIDSTRRKLTQFQLDDAVHGTITKLCRLLALTDIDAVIPVNQKMLSYEFGNCPHLTLGLGDDPAATQIGELHHRSSPHFSPR